MAHTCVCHGSQSVKVKNNTFCLFIGTASNKLQPASSNNFKAWPARGKNWVFPGVNDSLDRKKYETPHCFLTFSIFKTSSRHYFEKENFTSYANCLFPPCVHQVGCESTSTANVNFSKIFQIFVMYMILRHFFINLLIFK